MSAEPLAFDEFVDLLRVRLRDFDAQYPDGMHSFKEVMSDVADRVPEQWYWEAYDELEALQHLDTGVSHKEFGHDARGRLSAEGRHFVRSEQAGDLDDD